MNWKKKINLFLAGYASAFDLFPETNRKKLPPQARMKAHFNKVGLYIRSSMNQVQVANKKNHHD
jgi:hypothetical protein